MLRQQGRPHGGRRRFVNLLTLFPQGFYQSKSLLDVENASKELVFNPEAVIAHCFKQFKHQGRSARPWALVAPTPSLGAHHP